MQTTTNIGLKTYEANDPTDWLGEFNYNMNKIDTAVGAQNDQIDVIEETAGTAVTTANTASATASEALQTAVTKASIDDNVASASTTYSSNKINELISGGAVIDDTTTSTTKTWSSSKINTEVLNNRKIIEYLHSGKIYAVSPIASITEDTDLSNYDNNELSYTVTEDSIVLGTFKVYATALLNDTNVYGDFSPSFRNGDESNRQNYFDMTKNAISGGYKSGHHTISTIPTIIKAGSTIKLYNNHKSYNGNQIFSRVEIRLVSISNILN